MIQLPTGSEMADSRDTRQMLEWAIARWEAIQNGFSEGDISYLDGSGRVYKLLQKLSLLATEEEGIEFPTLFSRLAYMKSRHELSGQLIFALQSFRKQVEQKGAEYTPPELLSLGLWSTAILIQELWGRLPDYTDVRIS